MAISEGDCTGCSNRFMYEKNMNITKVLIVLLLFCTVNVYANWHQQEKAIMGTSIKVQVWHEDNGQAEAGMNAVMAEMERINQLMSPYIESSELFLLNKNAAEGPVKVSTELFKIIDHSLHISKKTNGAFDITFASVGFLYNYRERIKPAEQALSEKTQLIDYRQLLLDRINMTISYKKQGVKIDLGGIAKGYAVDNATEILKQLGFKHALVSAGGDTKLLGDHHGRPWLVAIQDPREKGKQTIKLPLQNEALSTSGDYERYFDQDGVRYHHIINPKTGMSASEVQSVSIIGPKAMKTDAFSTSVFVLGIVEGLAFINSQPGYEALIIDQNRRLHVSKGLEPQQ